MAINTAKRLALALALPHPAARKARLLARQKWGCQIVPLTGKYRGMVSHDVNNRFVKVFRFFGLFSNAPRKTPGTDRPVPKSFYREIPGKCESRIMA